jgi:hypothetical protein
MHYIFDKDGESHIIRGGDDMQKALGLDGGGRLVVMTDESSELVGTGFGAEKLLKSMPLVEAMRDGSLLIKKQPLAKSFGGFGQLIRELEHIKRGMRV